MDSASQIPIEIFQTHNVVLDFFGANPAADGSWIEIERRESNVRIWLSDPSTEIAPAYHSSLVAMLENAGLSHVQVAYIYSQSSPELH